MEEIKTPQEPGMHSRTELLFGTDNMERLQRARVIIFGVGGVGSWCAEALVRTGIGHLTIVDSDCVCPTNCNRQLMATSTTIGKVKVDVLRNRLQDIAPGVDVKAIQMNYDATTAESFEMDQYDVIVDAIDSLREKADLILRATALSKPVFISSMGAALRRDPLMVRKAEFWKVKGDPLARALRDKFKKQKTFPRRKFQCIYSEEPPMKNLGTVHNNDTAGHTKVQINGSICPITATFGMALASLAINAIVDVSE